MQEASRPSLTGVDEQILAEHRRIHDLNRKLQGAAELAALLACLAELRALLAQHFKSEEEDGGFFDVVRSTAPRHCSRVDHLQHEHHALLAEVDALAARASAALEGITAVLHDACALGRRLTDHEEAENHILIDTMYTDLGQAD